ncbi:MAG: hypothetical protein DME01_26000 [Candidatus Rokuibacteriota bacterium]|nr:MAG: hypothetical protein DME01_26000 [Candidatus Rokubacteria bacterium]
MGESPWGFDSPLAHQQHISPLTTHFEYSLRHLGELVVRENGRLCGSPQDGYLVLDRAKFRASFAADVDQETAAFMADSQVPWGLSALSGAISEPAWRTKPSWYLVVTEDQMIPVAAQRAMAKRAKSTIVEVKGSHAIYVSQPGAVAALIEQAAKSVKVAGA